MGCAHVIVQRRGASAACTSLDPRSVGCMVIGLYDRRNGAGDPACVTSLVFPLIDLVARSDKSRQCHVNSGEKMITHFIPEARDTVLKWDTAWTAAGEIRRRLYAE